MKLTQTDIKGQLAEAKDQLQMLDVEHAKTMNRYFDEFFIYLKFEIKKI